jgi:ribosomal protein S4E
MNERILFYAMNSLANITTDEKFYIQDNNIYIEFKDGRNLKISEDEVRFQASEYLSSEMSYIKNNF